MTKEEIVKASQEINGLGGMTVNERLFATNLIDEFDYCKKKDKEKATFILRCVKVDEQSIKKILKAK